MHNHVHHPALAFGLVVLSSVCAILPLHNHVHHPALSCLAQCFAVCEARRPLASLQVRSLLRSHSQGERSRASLAPGLYHPSPSIFSPSWSDRQGAVDDGAITGLRMRRSSAVRRPTPCHFSSLSSLLVHSSLFFWPSPPTVKFAGRSLLLPCLLFMVSGFRRLVLACP